MRNVSIKCSYADQIQVRFQKDCNCNVRHNPEQNIGNSPTHHTSLSRHQLRGMPSQCSKCSKNVTDKRYPGLSCASCNKIYHITCANLPKETFLSIQKNQLAWSCIACKNKPSTRRSGIFPPPGLAASQVPQALTVASEDKQLQDLILAFNSYKESTDKRIAHLESLLAVKTQQIGALSESVQKVEAKAEEIIQLSTANALEVQGIPEESLLSPTASVLSIASEIGCHLSAQDFDCSSSQTGTKPVLSIRFKSSEQRTKFLHAGKKFNRDKKRISVGIESYKIFVNEQLTSVQKRLLYNTKTFARERNYNFAWFCNGLVHLKRRNDSELKIIRTQDDLDVLAQNEAQLLLSERERSQIQDERTSPRRQIQQL